MLTVSHPASFSQPTPAAIVAPATESARYGAEVALFELAGTVRALRLGLSPFDVLSPAERQEQLDALLLADDARPVAELSNDELIALIAEDANTPFPRLLAASMEIDRRLKAMRIDLASGGAPDAAERQIIEDDDFREHQERTVAAEVTFAPDMPLHGRGIGFADEHPMADAFDSAFAG